MISQLLSKDERIQIGVGTYASSEPLIRLHHPDNRVLIGKFCSLANAVTIFAGGSHPIDFISAYPLKLFFATGDFASWTNDCADGNETTRIGNDVWLGHGSTILSGAEIGDGAIIGAQTVVRGKIPPYAIAMGNPAIIVRYRYDKPTIARLLAIKWWDWPVEKIKSEVPNLASNDITGFLNRHDTTNTDYAPNERLDMPFTSYAQNFEDVMLWRALKHIDQGCYIDVGAQHPIIDSVSKAFYERGWRGLHIEPVRHYASLLRTDRPDETVLQVALSNREGTLELNVIPETGLSTGVENYAQRHQSELGLDFQKISVPVTTLKSAAAALHGKDVHWLKIDVEGLETQVLEGWDSQVLRPWIIVLEATVPNTAETSHASWEPILTAANYHFTYFDGLNRFYIAQEHTALAAAFSAPPNVFDDILLTAHAPACRELIATHRARETMLAENVARLEATVEQQKASAARAAQLDSQLNAVLTSRSWHITRPLRWLTKKTQSLIARQNKKIPD